VEERGHDTEKWIDPSPAGRDSGGAALIAGRWPFGPHRLRRRQLGEGWGGGDGGGRRRRGTPRGRRRLPPKPGRPGPNSNRPTGTKGPRRKAADPPRPPAAPRPALRGTEAAGRLSWADPMHAPAPRDSGRRDGGWQADFGHGDQAAIWLGFLAGTGRGALRDRTFRVGASGAMRVGPRPSKPVVQEGKRPMTIRKSIEWGASSLKGWRIRGRDGQGHSIGRNTRAVSTAGPCRFS